MVADARAPRDGKFIERIGHYNPTTVPADIAIDTDKAYEWLMKGAQPTHTVRAILRYTGVLYLKHLQRGVAKGALTQEQADAKFAQFIADKAEKVQAHKEKVAKGKEDAFAASEQKDREARLAREAKAVAAAAPVVEPVAAEPAAEEPKAEEAPAEEPKAEEPAAEEPKAEEPAAEEPKAEEAPAEEPKAEEPAAEEPAAEEPKAEEAAAPVVAEAPAEADDLTKIEGIGPKIAEVLGGAGIKTFADLAGADADKVKEVLTENSLAQHDPGTWPKQAGMAAEGKWDELKAWQDILDGGKEPD